jgi:hypothetical protein
LPKRSPVMADGILTLNLRDFIRVLGTGFVFITRAPGPTRSQRLKGSKSSLLASRGAATAFVLPDRLAAN